MRHSTEPSLHAAMMGLVACKARHRHHMRQGNVDPPVGQSVGFERRILDGLCSYGITCWAVLESYYEFDSARIASHAAGFSAPVYPSDTIVTDLWRDGDVVSFEASVPERSKAVIKNGKPG